MRKQASMIVGTALSLQLAGLTACASPQGAAQQESDSSGALVRSEQSAATSADSSASSSASASSQDGGALRDVRVPATEEHVRLISRSFAQDGVTWLAMSGSAAEFAVTGTRATVELVGDEGVWSSADQLPRFAILLDGKLMLDDTLSETSRTVEVFSGNESRSAVVTVMLLSEARHGALGIASIEARSAATTPVTPTAAKDLRIEFIGDSITCGYAVETTSYDEPFSTSTENFMKSYAYLTAEALGADYDTCCYSGYGVVSGWSGDGMANTDMLLPPYYDVVSRSYPLPWDPSSRNHDVVVINLGTNDFSYTGNDESRREAFAAAYQEFLARVRAQNPRAQIVCTLGTMGGEELYPYLERAVESFRISSGDTRVSCFLSDPIDPEAEGIGTNGHPTALTQQRSAERLAGIIGDLLTDAR